VKRSSDGHAHLKGVFVRAGDYKYANKSSASCITETSMNKYDVIVIGGGHNGLVNAAYLARD
jgi:hypothetical protein